MKRGKPEASAVLEQRLLFLSTDASFNIVSFTFNSQKYGFGLHGFFEEFLPEESLYVKDFLVYSFEVYTDITPALKLSLGIENFLNIMDKSFELEPVVWNDDRLANLTILEHATAHLINIGIKYTF